MLNIYTGIGRDVPKALFNNFEAIINCNELWEPLIIHILSLPRRGNDIFRGNSYDQPILLLKFSNKDTRDNPSVVTAMKITIAITETIIAYSTAVAPFCSFKNLINCFILHLFCLNYVQL